MKVNLWFARDEDDEIVGVLNSSNDKQYTCPICESKVIPKALESKQVSPHFAHVDKEKCSSESMIHFWFKHKFIERGDIFTIVADEEYTYTCKNFKTEVTFNLESGTYRPDIVIETECGNEVIFEIANTNKKRVQDYIDRWIELDKIVVEIDIKSLQNVNEVKEFKALYYKGKCFNIHNSEKHYCETRMSIYDLSKSNKSVETVKKIEWFWYEINNQQVDDELMFEVFELFNYYEKEIFVKSRHTLTKIFMDKFLDYKRNNIISKYKHLEGFIDFYRTKRSMSIYTEGNKYCAILKTSLNLHYERLDDIYARIEKCYKYAFKRYEEYLIFNKINNCKNLTLV